MRLRRIDQSIWMYGFPIRKHHYTDRGLSKRYNSVSEKYAELKIVEHSSASSQHKSGGISNNAGKIINTSVKTSQKNEVGGGDAVPALAKCQSRTKNGVVVAPGNGVAGKYVGYEDELPNDGNVCYSYYGNLTGWHRYESDEFANACGTTSASGGVRCAAASQQHEAVTRSAARQPECVAGSENPSPLTCTKARFEWSKNDPQREARAAVVTKKSSVTGSKDTAAADSGERVAADTSLLKAVKLEDTSVLCDLLNENTVEDVNAVDATGRTVLSYAVLKSCIPLLEKILKIPEIDVNKGDNEGNTPLHFSAQAGQVEAVSLLLNCPCRVEIDARNIFGFTPLMKSALQGRTKCAKLLLFAGASPTMRDTGRGLRAEQWARFCGRYICADVIEKYARNQLLSKTASYGNWGGEPELGLHFVNGKLQPPAIALQNAINQSYKHHGIKSKLKKAFHHTNPTNWNSSSRSNSFSLVTQLTSAALCVSSPVLPNSSKVSPVVKSLIKPFVIPKIEITPDPDDPADISSPPHSVGSPETKSEHSGDEDRSEPTGNKNAKRRLSYLVKLRKKSYF